MTKKRKRILTIAVSLFLLSSLSRDQKVEPFYELLDDSSKAFARYSRGLVYIGTQELLDTINPCPSDVLVLDARDEKDPDMKVFSSHLVDDENDIESIVQILLKYEEIYNSSWERTKNAMILEWRFHNFLHQFNYELSRTTDVDFNNTDEEQYKNVFKMIGI